MLLQITTTARPATDIGYLLHKRPPKLQSFELGFGNAHVFWPEATAERATAALLLDIDPLKLIRGPGAVLSDYVNDRAYVSSSFLSVALSRVFGQALGSRCKERPELAGRPIPLEVQVAAVPCRGGDAMVNTLFGPLGYKIETSIGATVVATRAAGVNGRLEVTGTTATGSRYRNIRLQATKTLGEVLSHVYVLLPVLDNAKHYWIGDAEVEKLLAHGKGWLEEHPARGVITRRYLGHRKQLTKAANNRLVTHVRAVEDAEPDNEEKNAAQTAAEATTPASEAGSEDHRSLHTQRLDWVIERLKVHGAVRVVDLGCGHGQLLTRLTEEMVGLGLPRGTHCLCLAGRGEDPRLKTAGLVRPCRQAGYGRGSGRAPA